MPIINRNDAADVERAFRRIFQAVEDRVQGFGASDAEIDAKRIFTQPPPFGSNPKCLRAPVDRVITEIEPAAAVTRFAIVCRIVRSVGGRYC